MKILLLARYAALGASSRVRFYQYLPFLRANGIHLDVAPLFDDDYLRALYAGNKPSLTSVARAYFSRLTALLRLAHYDLIWLETQLFPWLPARFENFLPRPYVADYDDAVFHRYDQHSSRVVRAVLGKSIDSVMRHARIVIAGNDYLAARARQARAVQVEILPSVVDGLRYQPAVAPPQGNFTWLDWLSRYCAFSDVGKTCSGRSAQTSWRADYAGGRLPAWAGGCYRAMERIWRNFCHSGFSRWHHASA